MATAQEKQIAKSLGVTPAGLSFLARLKATGKASMRGNECGPLFDAGLIASNKDVPEGHGRRNTDWTGRWYSLTDAGCDVVKRARALGF